MRDAQLAAFFAGAIRLAMPVLFAAVGELVSERAGVLNLSLEGLMLTGAFGAALGAHATGSPIVGVFAGVGLALLLALVLAVLSVTLGANQLVLGIAANALALGLTTYLARELLGRGADSTLPGFNAVQIPLLHRIPLIGEAVFGQTALAYAGLLVAIGLVIVIARTGWGLAISAAGDDAVAADRAGSPVQLVRGASVLCAGAMAGLGGTFIALADVHSFSENMTSGRGYLAIVAVIAGSWVGWRVMAACLVFGAVTALQFQADALGIHIPIAILITGPYLLALLAAAGLVGRRRAPANLTIPFIRGTA